LNEAEKDCRPVNLDDKEKENDFLLICKNICKYFSGNVALNNVCLSIRKGEVHSLVGQNGAGKSTLVKIITGVYQSDVGEIIFEGKKIKIDSPLDAEANNIEIIHQDQQLIAQFDVTRNMFLGREKKTAAGLLDFKSMRKETQRVLKLIKAEFDADDLIRDITVGQREQVAIASALIKNPKLLILDEPTASLGNKEIRQLFEIIKLLKSQGVTIIYISHHFDEIFEISDRITILRDGELIGTLDIDKCRREEVIKLMVGREISQLYPKEDIPIGETVLEVKDLRQGNVVNGVNLSARKGEIVGISGLVGAGRTEMAFTIYGALKCTGGQVYLNNKLVHPTSPYHAKKLGIALIPEDRRNEGLVGNLSVGENLSLVNTEKWAKWSIINRKKEKSELSQIIDNLNIKTTGLKQLVMHLSGGNQQKVVIGRWLSRKSKVFIFDQPTTGVDVGAKVEIYKQMTNLAKNGATILFISSEDDELLGMADRIFVMAKGKVVKEFKHGEATEQDLLFWASGAA